MLQVAAAAARGGHQEVATHQHDESVNRKRSMLTMRSALPEPSPRNHHVLLAATTVADLKPTSARKI